MNGQPAVYTIGAWDIQFVRDSQDANGGKMISTWQNELQVKNLYWQIGKIYIGIVTDDEAVRQQQLIDMADSIHGK